MTKITDPYTLCTLNAGLSARMELKARGGCPNQTNLLIGHKAIATTVLWYCPGLTSPLTRNCEWTRLVSESRSFSPVF